MMAFRGRSGERRRGTRSGDTARRPWCLGAGTGSVGRQRQDPSNPAGGASTGSPWRALPHGRRRCRRAWRAPGQPPTRRGRATAHSDPAEGPIRTAPSRNPAGLAATPPAGARRRRGRAATPPGRGATPAGRAATPPGLAATPPGRGDDAAGRAGPPAGLPRPRRGARSGTAPRPDRSGCGASRPRVDARVPVNGKPPGQPPYAGPRRSRWTSGRRAKLPRTRPLARQARRPPGGEASRQAAEAFRRAPEPEPGPGQGPEPARSGEASSDSGEADVRAQLRRAARRRASTRTGKARAVTSRYCCDI